MLRPVPCAVIDAGDFDGVLLHLIDGDIRRKDQFAPTAHTSGTATVGEVLQCLAAVINSFHCFAGCGRVVFLDALEYVLQVFDSYR